MVESARSFRALGSDCSLRVWAEDAASGARMIDHAIDLLVGLDRKWSRFRADSELSELNRGAGKPVAVSSETCTLMSLAIEAWRSTDGLFDPTILGSLVGAGYDRTFDEITAAESTGRLDQDSFRPSPGLDGVVVDEKNLMVTLPEAVSLDLGGIGKGHAADLVLEQLLSNGAAGACIDLGGDVRVGGSEPEGGGWIIAVDDPFHPGEDLALISLSSGAVTTSSRLRRQWMTTDGPAHHLVDPSTGRPSRNGLAAVTVVAANAAWGEVHAKAALIAGPFNGVFLLAQAGLSGLLVQDDGSVLTAGAIDDYLINDSGVSL